MQSPPLLRHPVAVNKRHHAEEDQDDQPSTINPGIVFLNRDCSFLMTSSYSSTRAQKRERRLFPSNVSKCPRRICSSRVQRLVEVKVSVGNQRVLKF